jgi:hypothetical protein
MRLLAGPLLKIRVTVPEVVGVHIISRVLPAVGAYPPSGFLKGLGSEPVVVLVCAKASRGAASARRVVVEKRILKECVCCVCIRK